MPIFSPHEVYKLHGAGNDFLFVILLDPAKKADFDSQISVEKRSQWVQKICHPKFGLGTDGLAFIEPSDKFDFQWDFYNSDGSTAEMCGNAARCVSKLVYDLKFTSDQIRFQTIAGEIEAQILSSSEVEVSTTPIPPPDNEFVWSFENQSFRVQLIQTGVPHLVVPLNSDIEWMGGFHKKLALSLRFHPTTGKPGANVTFYKVLNVEDHSIQSVSFERGVEDFTLACGTGVLAAGWHHCQTIGLPQAHIQVPGGELRVDFSENCPKLIGPATYVAQIKMNHSLLKV